jgi:hypothetical protein
MFQRSRAIVSVAVFFSHTGRYENTQEWCIYNKEHEDMVLGPKKGEVVPGL